MILQVSEVASQIDWTRLLDQGPLVLLLVIAVRYLINRDNRRDEKLEKYIEQDRKEMLETLNNNTAAMKAMKEVAEKRAEVDEEIRLLLKQILINERDSVKP
ncbi:MAG TPA: hypothetical protein PK840_05615 [Bacilli bacterium]|nr:hypothetical protein [Bacilli bacterium]